MSDLTLYAYSDHRASANKVLVTAQYSGVNVGVRPNAEFTPSNHSTNSALSTIRSYDSRFPVLCTPHGPLYQTNAIARYVARVGSASSQLLGENAHQQALISQWIDFNSNELFLPVAALVYPILGFLGTTDHEKEVATSSALHQLRILDNYLLNHTFLVVDRVTLADILISLTVFDLYVHVLDEQQAKSLPNITRWFLTLMHQKEFQTVLGKSHFAADSYLSTLGIADYVGTVRSAPEETPSASSHSSSSHAVATTHHHHHHHGHHAVTTSTSTVVHSPTTYKKLTEKDLELKAIPSQYHSPGATKEKPHGHNTAAPVIRSIQQPR